MLDSAGVQRAHVVGLSWGGLLAQEFYRRYPSYVISLVLADTYAGWKGSLPAPLPEQRLDAAIKDSLLPPSAFVQKYLPGMFGGAAAPEIRQELADVMAEFHPAGFRLMATALAKTDTREFLPMIKVPTLLIWGDADKRAPLDVGRTMRDAIPAARLEIIRGAGHLSSLERAAQFSMVVRDFCLSLPPQ